MTMGILLSQILQNEELAVQPNQPLVPRPMPIPSDIGSLSASASALAARDVIPENNRDGGIKYFEALNTLQGVLGPECEGAILRDLNNSPDPSERIFLRELLQAVQAIKGSNFQIRERNTKVIQCLRNAIKTDFYQQKKTRGNVHCSLVQQLCDAKFAKVYPSEAFKELVGKAALSASPHALDGLNEINKHTVGLVTREINRHLHHATSEYSKGTIALLLQKARGEFGGEYGLVSDPGGTSNVPYLRSRFSVDDGAEEREINYCRFGTPTIQQGGKTEIDPMLLSALDAMKERGQNFLYVNHQKLDGREGVRANAIAAIQETHENFHFLSIPLDGPIVDTIRNTCSINQLKNLIQHSYKLGINGCMLPAGAGVSSDELRPLLEHIHLCWFAGKEKFTREDLEAFWGIFNTTLKHCVIKKLNIHAMNSSCKDNKDRGGTLGTIDEAVRNVLLGQHEDPARLRELVNNALAPFMIKLEHILDDPSKPNHHRLGYLVSVLNHIATISPEQINAIQKSHSELCLAITGQEMSPRPKEANVSLQQPELIDDAEELDELMIPSDPEDELEVASDQEGESSMVDLRIHVKEDYFA